MRKTNINSLTLLHSERPKLYGVLAVLSATGLNNGIFKVVSTKKSRTDFDYKMRLSVKDLPC